MEKQMAEIYLYIDKEDTLEECLKGIFEDNRGVVEQVGITILDPVGCDTTQKCLLQYREKYNECIKYISCAGQKAETAYKEALKAQCEEQRAEYVVFMKSTTIYAPNSLLAVLKKMRQESGKLLSLTPTYYNKKGTLREYLKFEKPRDTYIDVTLHYSWYNPYLPSYFVPLNMAMEIQMKDELTYEGMMDYLIHLVDKAGGYYLLADTLICREDLEVDPYNYPPLFEKDWYTKHVESYMIPLLQQKPSKFVQFAMLYSLGIKFAGNLNDRNKTLFTNEEIDQFFDIAVKTVKLVDDDVLLYNDDMEMKRVLARHMHYRFYWLKYDRNVPKVTFAQNDDEYYAMSGDHKIELVSNMDVKVNAINNEKHTLDIWGKLKNVYFMEPEKIKVYARVGNTEVAAMPNEIYSLTKFFGRSVHKDYSFSISIPKQFLKNRVEIAIHVEYEGEILKMPVRFSKPQAHFWGEFPNAYWRFDDYYLTYRVKKHAFLIEKANPLKGIVKELAYWGSFLKYGEEFQRSVKTIPLRLLYFITRPYYRQQNIWITYDQLFKGGDNGEYFYRYVSERKDKGNVKIYYIVNKNTKEYKELNAKYGTVLPFNSLKHKLVCLHANYIFATRVAFNVYCGYWKQTERYFRDLFNADVFCLQHGLTIQKIAQYQNRLFDNTKLYFCVSPVEMDNLRNKVYGYKEEELILTGAPRYDGLISKDQRYVLISPTWRRNVTAGTNKKGANHAYSPNFKHSEYFRIYNSLINDEKLISYAKKYNYKLIYLIHPILSPQLKDFTTNDYVEIIPGAGSVSYEKILSEASLMLTDHSGVQFDFAYMRKPLVYYHPDTLPPQYDEGGLKYEINGFGPVCKNHEQVVDALCDYMANQCVIKEEYKQRVEKFFQYDDHKNCERVYEAAVKYIREEENK